MFKFFLGFLEKKNKKREQIIKRQIDFDKKLIFSLSKSRIPTREQLKYLPKFLGRQERLILMGLIFIFFVSLIFFGARIYFLKTEKLPDLGGEYVEGLVGNPQYINPILAQANDVDSDLVRLVFSGLFKYNEKKELEADLASGFEVSEDKKVYTIYLKDGVRWHDGENLTTSDIVFTIASIQDPQYKSPLYSSFKGVRVEKIDEKTVRFNLEEPYAPFLGMLTFGILPAHLWYNIPPQSANLAEYNIKPIGSGPFRFKSLIKDKNGNVKIYTLVRNEDFYGQKPFLKKLIFKFYPDYAAAILALENRNIEAISFLPQEFLESVKSKRWNKYYLFLPQYTAIFFNQKNNEFLKNETIRRVLVLALDRLKIVSEALNKEGELVNGPILPGYVGYSSEIKKFDFNPTLAQELLEKEGFKLDGGVRKKDDKVLKITLTTVDRPEYAKVAEIIKKAWEAIGIEVVVQNISGVGIQQEIIRPRAYEALLLGTIVSFDSDPFPFWHSSQVEAPGLNLSLYANRKVDKLLEEARQIDNPEEKAKKYIEFQNILAEDIPAIFLYSPRHIYVVDKDVQGINISYINIPSDRFAGIENWYKKTKRKWR